MGSVRGLFTLPFADGRAGDGDQLIGRAAASAQVPQNSLFTLHVLRLAAGGPAVSVAWFVQEDSRAFIIVDSAALPSDLQRGRSVDVPFTLLNTGENAGAFQLSIVLSRNSFPGATDIRLGRRSFSSLTGGGRIQSTMTIQLPSDVPDGRYFIATFLEVPTTRDKLLRVHNGNFVRPVQLGSFPAPGRLTVSLNWSGSADLDLHVTDPMGETLYYFHPASAAGGSISRDRECAGQQGQSEVVSYPAGQAVSGKYQISVHYFRACGAAKDVAYNVSVESDAGTQTFNGVVHPGDYTRVADYVK